MRQRWEDATFLHWPTDPELISKLIHPVLEPDVFEGTGWVGLVPFRMVGISWRRGPTIPYFGTFPEINVRTYVTGPHGPGVWFNSLEAARLLPVLVARLGYRLPYFHAAMRIERFGTELAYNSIRRWPGPRGAGGSTRIEVGEEISPSPLDVFLTARWRLYTQHEHRLMSAEVRHPAWPLRSASPNSFDDELIRLAGYPPMVESPVAVYSPGVPVEVYRPVPID